MACSTELVQQDPIAGYRTTSTSKRISYLEKDNGKDIAYCGGVCQSSEATKQPNQYGKQHRSMQKTSTLREHPMRQHNAPNASQNLRRDLISENSLSEQPASLLSKQLDHSSLNKPPPIQQHTELTSLPFPNYAQISNTLRPRTYQPPPVTDCYQLDRFLDEIPDFRAASLSDRQEYANEASKGAERSRKHRHALAVRIRSLQGSIEGF